MENMLGISQAKFRSAYLAQTNADGSYQEFGPIEVEHEQWYLPSPDGSSGLCRSCQHIDFHHLFSNEYAVGRGPTLVLQDMIRVSQTCPFCSIAVHALRCFNENEEMQPHKDNIPVICQITTVRKSSSLPNASCYMVLFRKLLWQRAILGYGGFLQLLSPGASFEGRTTSSSVLDVSLLKTWLQKCEEDHSDTNFSPLTISRKASPQLRLIDVQDQCIVEKPDTVRYLALSYVWGQVSQLELKTTNQQDLMTTNALMRSQYRDHIPRSVLDAIHLTAMMDERYLWVDALCIIQDGPDKAAQIQNMDRVYSSAVLTIVSCAGDNANAGLPRLEPAVVSNTSQVQRSCIIRGRVIGNVLSFADTIVNGSVWNSRAWTYQERILSRRSLFITPAQAFFECEHRVSFCEETNYEAYPTSRETALGFPGILGGSIRTNTEVYAQAIEDFSGRRLTNAEDGIAAVQGILNVLEPRFRSKFIGGLPASEIDMALLWQPLSSIERRRNRLGDEVYPSWSWAGWTGAVHYSLGAEPISRVTWLDPTSSMEFTSDQYRQPRITPSVSKWIESGPEDLLYEEQSYYEKHNPSVRFVHQIASEEERTQFEHLALGSNILHFFAWSADMLISNKHSVFGSIIDCGTDSAGQITHRLCSLIVADANGFAVGVVHVPGKVAQSLTEDKHEFIALSRTRLMSDDSPIDLAWTAESEVVSAPSQPSNIDVDSEQEVEIGPDDQTVFDINAYDITKPRCLYNVMLVETHGDRHRRIRLGKIHIDGFVAARPQLKLIRLE